MSYKGFNPSSANRWVQCPGSVKASQDYLDFYERGEAAEEGTAAHEVIERLRKGEEVLEGQLASNGVAITGEMIEGAQLMLMQLPEHAKVEARIDCKNLREGMFGFVDAYAFNEDETHLQIWDYKFGHTFVDAFENWQMLVEACVLARVGTTTQVTMTIVQPRCFVDEMVRSWTVSVDDIINTYIPRLRSAVEDALSDTPTMTVGSHCAYCPARHACKALQQSSMSVLDVSKGLSTVDLTPDQTAQELQLLQEGMERLKARLSGIEQQATVFLEAGVPVRGFTLQPQQGRQTWTIADEMLFATADALGVDLRKPPTPMTPAQAVKAGLSKKVVESISAKPDRGSKLVKIKTKKLEGTFKK